MTRKKINVLSLFDGMSCGRLALECAGIPVARYVAFEIDKYAIQISKKNYPSIEHVGSVVGADFSKYKGFDMVIGGFPCTDLSVAKAGRKGLAGQHSSLFWELVRAIKEVQPRFFLVENNASMPAADRAIITKTLGVEPIMINSALVSAQHRKRLYWTNIPSVTQPQEKGILLCDILESGVTERAKSLCLTTSPLGNSDDYLKRKTRQAVFEPICVNSQSGRKDGKAKQPSVQDRIYSVEGKTPALATGFRPNIAVPIRLSKYEKSNKQAMRVYSVRGKSVSLKATTGGGGAQTGLYKIDLPDGDYIIRKLTPIEAERLQALPDNYTAGVSDTQRYKCCGNGWTGDVIVHILNFYKST